MAETVVTGAKHLEELAPTPAKLSKLTGYDTLDPDETRAYIAEVLRVYSKQNKPYKIRSRRNPISDFKTTWKIKHDGKHIGDINLETHKPHGVGFGYGISKASTKHHVAIQHQNAPSISKGCHSSHIAAQANIPNATARRR